MSTFKINNQREAIETLIRNGIECDDNAKVILFSRRQPGLKLLTAIDYLKNRCNFNQLGEVATESFLKAREIQEKRNKKKEAANV